MKNEKKIRSYFLLIAFGIFLYVVAVNYRSLLVGVRYIFAIIKPFIIGSVIAFIINVPMRALEHRLFKKMKKKNIQRVFSLLTTLIILILVIWAIFTMILPELYSTIDSLGQRVPGAIEKVIEWGNKMAKKYPQIEGYIVEAEDMLAEFDWKETLSQSLKFVKNGVGGFVNTTIDIVGNVVGSLVNFGVGFVFAIYVLLQKEKLASHCKQFLYAVFKEERADEIVRIGKLIDHIFSNFLSGQVVEAIILGSMFFIAMSIFKLPYAMLVGVLIAVTALIPIFGAFIGLGIGAFLILMVDPMQALWFIIMFFVLQQIEGNLIYPAVVGNSIGLPGIWVLIAVSVGGSMFGVAGMIVFIPTVSVMYTLIREFVKKRLKEKDIDVSKWRVVYATEGEGRIPEETVVEEEVRTKEIQEEQKENENLSGDEGNNEVQELKKEEKISNGKRKNKSLYKNKK